MKVGLLIPAYNVEDQIGALIQGARPWVDRILVLDDGSSDQTREKALGLGTEVISNKPNRGKGYALKQGFAYFRFHGFEAIVTMDGDGQHDPRYIPHFLEAYKKGKAQVIIGSRMEEGSKIPKARYVPNLIGTYCLSWATGQYVPDSQSGYRLYEIRALEGLSLKDNRFALETEVLIRLAKRGCLFASIPIPAIYNEGGQVSNFRPVKDIYKISMLVLRSIFWKRETPRPKGTFLLPFRRRFG